MFDDVGQDLTARLERKVTARMDELKKLISWFLSCGAKETGVPEESDTVKVLLFWIETRFQAEHAGPVEAINTHCCNEGPNEST